MYHHVLVAVDGGACALRALTEAIRLAAACRAQLEVVHVIDYSFLQYDSGYGMRADIFRNCWSTVRISCATLQARPNRQA